MLLQLAEGIRAAAEELAALESRNVGKPIQEARGEVEMGAACFQYYAGLIPAFGGQTVPVGAPGTGLTFREPVGVCGLIVPWNFPFAITTWKVAPGPGAGQLGRRQARVRHAADGPAAGRAGRRGRGAAGCAQRRAGTRAARPDRPWPSHPDVRKIAFTGSTEVGSEVMRMAAGDVKRVSLELGGKSANLIFADADLEKAGRVDLRRPRQRRAGLLRPQPRAGRAAGLRRDRGALRRARPRAPRRRSPGRRDARWARSSPPSTASGWTATCGAASSRGRRLCTGGRALRGGFYDRGSFYEPAVFRDVTPGMEIAQEEIFGPVVAILPFDTEEEAIRLANGTVYGLSGSLWTRDIGRALRVVRAVETGVISVNSSWSVHLEMPFGGVKRSGVGRELGPVGPGALQRVEERVHL